MNIEKVLMIEDDANIRLIAEIALEGVGNWTVLLADCGETGIETALAEKPDLILLDVMMPGMDGPTTLARLKELMNPLPPVIFMTAKVQSTEIAYYQGLGAAGVIRKPFDPITLPDQIMALLDGPQAPMESQEIATC
jgi:two-component system, OmpR family, response regulator